MTTDAKEILLAAFTKLKPYFEGGPDLEGKPLLELVEAVKEIADPTQKQQKLIAGCMPIIQKELGDELATKGFAPPMGKQALTLTPGLTRLTMLPCTLAARQTCLTTSDASHA